MKNRKPEFLHDLNEFLKAYKQGHDIDLLDEFTEDDLRKIAFWMATGSGKTLLMHINYHQFQRYKLFSPDNILLITPNEGLSRQHCEELQKSGIPCRLYAGNIGDTGNLYFYLDGYGKDFTVLNVKQGGVGEQAFQEMIFMANLLSYFQQLLIYEQHQPLARQYNLEKPLWIFVGTTVTGRE